MRPKALCGPGTHVIINGAMAAVLVIVVALAIASLIRDFTDPVLANYHFIQKNCQSSIYQHIKGDFSTPKVYTVRIPKSAAVDLFQILITTPVHCLHFHQRSTLTKFDGTKEMKNDI